MVQPNSFSDATELLRQMRSGERSSEEIVLEHLNRIELENPRMNAAVHVFREEALAQAKSPMPGSLSGLPITLKETYGIKGCEVTIGSRRMRPIQCAEDSEPVKKLREAGAIIIARSNVPEFVMTGETNNLLYGRTNHPTDSSRTCGGSTGGEGALVGSGCSPLGFGTDILGSIRIPASFCGIVGFRPHSNAIDKTGVWPISGDFFETWNGTGPMTRSVRDARLAYNILAKEPLSSPAGIKGLRLITADGFQLKYKENDIQKAFLNSQEALQSVGMNVERHTFTDVPELFLNIPKLVAGEMTDLWIEWLSSGGEKFKLSSELVKQALRRPTVDPAFFKWILMSPLVRPRRSGALARIIKRYEEAREHYYQVLGQDGILILPTLGLLAPKHGGINRQQRPGINGLFTAETFVNYLNLSAITLPAHKFADPHTGLKPGIMLACAPGAEARLLDVATELETEIS